MADFEETNQGIALTQKTLDCLESLRAHLCKELGFEITMDNTVSWLLKKQGFEKPVELIKQLSQLMSHGRKIDAIKLVREHMQLGLREAKDYVEDGFKAEWSQWQASQQGK